MNAKEIRYIFSPAELREEHDRMFLAPRFILLAGIIAWILATLQQIEIFPEQRAELVAGVFPMLIWYAGYSACFFFIVRSFPARRMAAFQSTIAMDVLFITMLINVTGQCQSNFYLAYYLFIAVEVFYFGIIGGAALTFISCFAYLFVYIEHSNQIFIGDFALRAGFMFLTFFVLATLAENEKKTRLQMELKKNEIEALNLRLETTNQRLVEENDFKEHAATEKNEILKREQSAAQRRRQHIDFAGQLNAKGTIEEVYDIYSRYIASLLSADNVSLVMVDRPARSAVLYHKDSEGEVEKKDIPVIHPLIEAFYGDTEICATERSRTWTSEDREPVPDSFLIVPGGRPEVLHVEAVKGGVVGASILIVISRNKCRPFSDHLMEESRLISNHLAVAVKNISLRARLQELADTDGLTGLFNHRFFKEALAKEMWRSKRYERPLTLILFDIDHFKNFNDTYGHPIGDAVLKELAKITLQCIRNVDTACRYGGEEFVVILPETDASSALAVAERIRRTICEHVFEFKGAGKLNVTVSLGLGSMPPAETMEDLISVADQALYRAKEGGRNQVAS